MNANSTLHRAQGPAARVAHALNEKIDEIAAGVSVLRGQADAPPPQAETGIEENPNPWTERDAGIPAAETNPPMVGETAVVPSRVEITSRTPAAVVTSSSPAREKFSLPPVVDVRPELAAFTAAVTRQQQATVLALRQATECCQRQQLQLDRFRTELERLDSRIQNLTQRP